MNDLQVVLALVRDSALAGVAVFLRVGAAMALLPAFAERPIPPRIRLMLALAFTIIAVPALPAGIAAALTAPGAVPRLWLGEPLVGLAFGLSLRLAVMALQMAGTIAAQSLSLSQLYATAGAEPVTVVGEVLTLGGLALACILGLHVALAEALVQTYRVFPPGGYPAADELVAWAAARVSATFALAVSLALPFVTAALIYNVALGVINKAMPQLMVAMVGAPALTAGGMLLLLLLAPVLLQAWTGHLAAVLGNPF